MHPLSNLGACIQKCIAHENYNYKGMWYRCTYRMLPEYTSRSTIIFLSCVLCAFRRKSWTRLNLKKDTNTGSERVHCTLLSTKIMQERKLWEQIELLKQCDHLMIPNEVINSSLSIRQTSPRRADRSELVFPGRTKRLEKDTYKITKAY